MVLYGGERGMYRGGMREGGGGGGGGGGGLGWVVNDWGVGKDQGGVT